ncbi:hypothetical protein [Streptomyces cinereoruber]|uniref:hypothetical protein n=1 Tax=Streptomyces cinereoruber TaxID=67260 RepID=UPI003398F412
MPKITSRRGNTYDTDERCNGELLALAMNLDDGGSQKAAEKVLKIREQHMEKGRNSCGDRLCCS